MGKGGCRAGGAASVIRAARAPKTALPASTVVGLRDVRDTAMPGRGLVLLIKELLPNSE
jgi:hypothetical protein